MLESNTHLIASLPRLTRLNSQKVVAMQLGIGAATYSRWCRGSNLKIADVEKMAQTFHLPMGCFMKISGKEAESVGRVEEWTPVEYDFSRFYDDLQREMSIDDIARQTKVSKQRLQKLRSNGDQNKDTLHWQEFISLLNIAHLYPEPYIKDRNGIFPMDEETRLHQPNYHYLETRLKEADELVRVREEQNQKLRESEKEVMSLKEYIRHEKLKYGQLSTLLENIDKGRSTKRVAYTVEMAKLRIKELLEDKNKEKDICLRELYDLLDR